MKSNMCAATVCCGGSEGVKHHFQVALKRDNIHLTSGRISNSIMLWMNYAILDQTYPGVNTYFDSPARSDGSQK